MANVFVEESTLTAIADAIREKTGAADLIFPADMAMRILGITSVTDDIQLTDVASYYQESTRAVADEINALGDEYVSFVIVTDSHGSSNKNNSQNIIRYLLKKTKANRVFHLGDVSGNNWSEEEYKAWFAPFEKCLAKLFFALGNHELQNAAMDDVTVIYDDLLAGKLYLKGNPEGFYYYFDDAFRKIRYLVINTSDGAYNAVTGTQAAWIQESVQLPTSDWKLIAFGHMDIMPDDPITNAWNSNSESAVTNALSSTNGVFVGYFCGHQHHDRIVKVNDAFYQVSLLNDSCVQDTTFAEINNPKRTAGTASEQAVSIVSVNTETGDVTIRRIGAGADMAYNYMDETVEPDNPDEPNITLVGISATYSGGDVAVGTDVSALNGIVVTAEYSDGSTETVTDYSLSGTIAEGSNTVTVSYGGMSTTFNVTGIAESGGDDGEKEEYENWTNGVPYEFEFVENKYIDSNGNYVAYNDWGTTPFLPCYGASSITLTAIAGTYAMVGIADSAFYDVEKKKCSDLGSSEAFRIIPSADEPVVITVPAGACYVVFTGDKEKYYAAKTGSIYNLIATPNA